MSDTHNTRSGASPPLKPHPLSIKLYGKPKVDPDLVKSIQTVGLLNPILVNISGEILSGNRRYAAYLASGQPLGCPPRTVCSGVESSLGYERLVIEGNRQRIKTPEQKAREFKELKRIESALIKERETQRKKQAKTTTATLRQSDEKHWTSKENKCSTGKRGFDCPDDIWQLMRQEGTIAETDFIAYVGKCGTCGRCHRDKDQSGHAEGSDQMRHQTWYRPDEINKKRNPTATDIAAAAVDEKPRTMSKLEAVVDAADAGDTKARANLDAVNAGTKTVNAAAIELAEAKRRKGFRKANPEYADKSDEVVDAAIQKKYGTETQLKQSLRGGPVGDSEKPSPMGGSSPTPSLQSSEVEAAIQGAVIGEPTLPPNSEPKKGSLLADLRAACSVLDGNSAVQGWSVNQTTADVKTRMGRYDLNLLGLTSTTIKKVLDGGFPTTTFQSSETPATIVPQVLSLLDKLTDNVSPADKDIVYNSLKSWMEEKLAVMA